MGIFLRGNLFRDLKIYNQIRNFAYSSVKKAVVFIADGTEEIEFASIVDVLRRADIKVYIAGIPKKRPIKCDHGMCVNPDIGLADVDRHGPYHAMILPGGFGGATTFSKCEKLGCLLTHQFKTDRIVAAICASPIALRAHKIGKGKCITSYPAVEKAVIEGRFYKYKQDAVVVDGNLITSRGPGTALIFALKLVDRIVGPSTACLLAKEMLVPYQ